MPTAPLARCRSARKELSEERKKKCLDLSWVLGEEETANARKIADLCRAELTKKG